MSEDMGGAMAEFEAMAKGSTTQKYLIHVSLSPSQGEEMTPAKWARAWEVFEQVQGLENHAYSAVEHEKQDRTHQHRVYSRVDMDTGAAAKMGFYKVKNERIGRQLEVEFGHDLTQGRHTKSVIKALRSEGLDDIADKLEALEQGKKSVAQYQHAEHQAEKRGVPLAQIRAEVAQAWTRSDSPKALEVALAQAGYALAKGDKVPVIVDQEGREYPALRTINAGRKAQGLERIKKTDLAARLPQQLPDLDAIREAQTEQQQTQHAGGTDMDGATGLKPQPETATKDGSIEEANATTRKKEEDKAKILADYYRKEIGEHSRLAKYWRIEQQEDGTLKLANKAAQVHDKGDLIDVDSKAGKTKRGALAAVELAQLKGWGTLKVDGSEEFKKATFEVAAQVGIKVELETEKDKELWAAAQARAQKIEERQEPQNSVSQGQAPQEEPGVDNSKPRGPRM
ncbi:MAG: relaxase/mobilization nuclease domain-containing protein [gamma proteobacterium symbiont of Clathrolucina costata]